jgi:rhodanese-related sulfurtransferase
MLRFIVALCVALAASGQALAYDEALAANYRQLFSAFDERETAKSLHFMLPEQVVERIKKGEPVVLLDVRTEREQSIVGITLENALHTPMNRVFEPKNLAAIPTDKPVVVTCQSGVRCTAVAMALRNIGFDNVYSMKGGLVALIQYLNPKTAF